MTPYVWSLFWESDLCDQWRAAESGAFVWRLGRGVVRCDQYGYLHFKTWQTTCHAARFCDSWQG